MADTNGVNVILLAGIEDAQAVGGDGAGEFIGKVQLKQEHGELDIAGLFKFDRLQITGYKKAAGLWIKIGGEAEGVAADGDVGGVVGGLGLAVLPEAGREGLPVL